MAFSSGNIYPFTPLAHGGPTETYPPAPVGEYAQSVLGRERMFQYCSKRFGTPCVLLRLNYAIELRYGVLLDIGRKVFERRPVDVTMGARERDLARRCEFRRAAQLRSYVPRPRQF